MAGTMDIISITMKVPLSGTYKCYTYTQTWWIRIYTEEGLNLEMQMQQFGTKYVSIQTQFSWFSRIEIFPEDYHAGFIFSQH